MRQEHKHLKLRIKSNDKDNNIINQQTITVSKHDTENTEKQKYLVLSKNDFGKNLRINAGIFNKKTKFIITEDHSLLVLDKNGVNEAKVSELISSDSKYMIYMIPIFALKQNYDILIKHHKHNNETFNIELNFELGRALGRKMKNQSYENLETIAPKITEDQKIFLDNLIKNNEKINFDKRLLISSNYKFLLGILYELYEEKFIINNINIYLITTILNMLGASYSIRNISEKKGNTKFYIRFKLPIIFKSYLKKLKYLKNPEFNKNNIYNKKLKMIRNKKIIVNTENIENDENAENVKNNQYTFELINFKDFKEIYKNNIQNLKENKSIINYINLGIIELMPINDFKFIPLKNKDVKDNVYDFVTEGVNDATNYILPGLPLLKNSDGDILALIGIWTKDAANEADEKFGINKRTVLSELDGKPYSWIDIDSVLGLYNFTK